MRIGFWLAFGFGWVVGFICCAAGAAVLGMIASRRT